MYASPGTAENNCRSTSFDQFKSFSSRPDIFTQYKKSAEIVSDRIDDAALEDDVDVIVF